LTLNNETVETAENQIAFKEETLKEVGRVVAQYPEGMQKSALIRVLHLAQAEFGWLSVPVMDYVARLLHVNPVEVYEVATFYSMYDTKPAGKVKLEVCRTGPCMIEGAERIVKYIEDKLGIKDGETTSDGLFTLKTVECLGACGYAPMLQAGEKYHEHLIEAKIDELIETYRANPVANYMGMES
jgi:NADH-quinone oxidoreductase subunit E